MAIDSTPVSRSKLEWATGPQRNYIAGFWKKAFSDQDDFLYWCRDAIRLRVASFDVNKFIDGLTKDQASRIITGLKERLG